MQGRLRGLPGWISAVALLAAHGCGADDSLDRGMGRNASTGGGSGRQIAAGGSGSRGLPSPLPAADRAILEDVGPRLAVLAENSMEFWLKYAPDTTHGGVYRLLQRDGSSGPEPGQRGRKGGTSGPNDKPLLQLARHLWTYSFWYERREATPAVKAVADGLYQFLTTNFVDETDGEFFLAVSPDGAMVTDMAKRIYDEAFAIYALSTYGRVFHVPQAITFAEAAFLAIDARAHDATDLGYIVDNGLFWGSGKIKQTNTHIHVMEALAALNDARTDATVTARLEEHMDLISTQMLQPEGHLHQEFGLDWTPAGDVRMRYGHDLETAWLMRDAARSLGRPDDATVNVSARIIGEKSAREGYDATNGGYYQWGYPDGNVDVRDKEWWVQMEALLGLLTLYRLTGDAVHLQRFDGTLEFIESHLYDAIYGDFYVLANEDGSSTPDDIKANFWKGPYHTIRALVLAEDWVGELLQ